MKLTPNEIKLFRALKFTPKEIEVMEHNLMADNSYKWAIEKVFVENQTGPAVETLRRVYIAVFMECRICRNTPPFESLAEIGE